MKTLAPEKKSLALYLLLIFLGMFVLTTMTPLAGDDYNYAYSFKDFHRLTSVWEIFPSMAAHRIRPNGRVFAHGLVQLFMLGPKVFFNLCNAGNAALMAYVFSRYIPGEKPGRQFLLLSVGAMIIWCFSPKFGDSFLWLDGALNYSWGLTVMLLFLWPFAAAWLELPRRRTVLRDIGFCLLAFVAGSYSENGSVSILFAAGCVLLLLVIREKKLPLPLALAYLAAVLGFIWLITAPGTAHRGARLTLSTLGANYFYVLNSVRSHLLPLYLVYGALMAAALSLGADRRALLLSGILILAGFASLASFVFAAYFVPRHYCFTVVTAALAGVLLLRELLKSPRRLLVFLCAGALSVLFLFNAAAGLLDILVGFRKTLIRERTMREAHEAGQSTVVLEEHLCSTSYGINFELNDFGPDWPNMWIAKYNGFEIVYKAGTEPSS